MREPAFARIDDVTVVIRCVGERTEAVCRDLVVGQVASEAQVVLVREKPFSTALLHSFERGIAAGRDWTLCIDADVLIRAGALFIHREHARALARNAFGFSGYLVDKFYSRKKRRGLHFYRTSLLDKALPYVGRSGGEMRPETFVKGAMQRQGHRWGAVDEVFGIHDFEQYFGDIFRKMAVRAQKSPGDCDWLLRRADRLGTQDDDFFVARLGLHFGRSLQPEAVSLHADHWHDTAEAVLASNALAEKPELDVGSLASDHVQRAIAGTGRVDIAPVPARSQFVRRGIWTLGRLLARVGARLQQVV